MCIHGPDIAPRYRRFACSGLFLCLVLGPACNVLWVIEKDYKLGDVMAVDSLVSAGRRIDFLPGVRSDHTMSIQFVPLASRNF